MNKIEYIDRLAYTLRRYDVDNLFEILADYEQIVEEILIENNSDFNYVIDKLGYPEILALELVNELDFKLLNTAENKNFAKKNHHNKFKPKSNTFWEFLLAIYYFIQSFFVLAIILLSLFIFYNDFNSKLTYIEKTSTSTTTSIFKLCTNTDCQIMNIEQPFSSSHTDTQNLIIDSFPIMWIILVFDLLVIIFLILNHYLIFHTIKRKIKKNTTYNRRRFYE